MSRHRGLPAFSTLVAGAATALLFRALLPRLILLKLRRDVRALNAGDYRPLLSGYAEDAVLRFNEGDHRWAGEHRGKAALERFFRDFVGAGITGEIGELIVAGPLWRLTLIVRFDDQATAPDGEVLYRNRTVLVVRSRWGRIVEQDDFYEDTGRIAALDARLLELGIAPVTDLPKKGCMPPRKGLASLITQQFQSDGRNPVPKGDYDIEIFPRGIVDPEVFSARIGLH